MTCTQVARDTVMQTPFLAVVSSFQCTSFDARGFAAAARRLAAAPPQIAIYEVRELAISDPGAT
jgi:hypothetical protein